MSQIHRTTQWLQVREAGNWTVTLWPIPLDPALWSGSWYLFPIKTVPGFDVETVRSRKHPSVTSVSALGKLHIWNLNHPLLPLSISTVKSTSRPCWNKYPGIPVTYKPRSCVLMGFIKEFSFLTTLNGSPQTPQLDVRTPLVWKPRIKNVRSSYSNCYC